MLPAKRRKTRYLCSYCKQSLAHTAYHRHQQLPHIYCPACKPEEESSSGSDSTFDLSDVSSDIPSEGIDSFGDHESESDSESEADWCSSSESESAPEIWDEPSSSSSDSELDSCEQDAQTHLHYMVCVFLSFFQLCFRISDRAVMHLLTFLSGLFRYFSSIAKDAPLLKMFSEGFPKTLYSMRKCLKLQTSYVKYVVCPRCHRLYNESDCIIKVPSGEMSLKCDFARFPNHPQRVRRRRCGAELMKKVKIGQKYRLVPRKVYVYYDIIQSLQRLVSKPGFLDLCERWRNRNIPAGCLADVYDGKLWKEWMNVDGVPFLEVPGNLVFMLNVDWFQPFERTQYSVGVIYLVIQNLPRTVRFKPENVIIVATIPGPKEPSCADLNPYLVCMVDNLLKLWEGVQLQIPSSILGTRLIRAALVYTSSDLPATRKICGFYGTKATHGCSKCLKSFPSTSIGHTDYSGFDRNEWQPRDIAAHRLHTQRARDATTQSKQQEIEKEMGVRYSELLRLPYFDVVRYHLVDPMHNLFLGTAKKLLQLWKVRGFLTERNFESIQEQMDEINPPADIGRMPHKISAQFAGFTAEQWMLWTTVFSPLLLRDFLPQEHFAHWCMFSEVCSLLCHPHIHESDVHKADGLLLAFCKRFQELYGEDECTPNMHMHCHLKECILDVGPLHTFWCFSFERYNGILEKMQKSWQAPEVQLIHKFSNLQTLASLDLPEAIPSELRHCFMQMKEAKTVVPNTTDWLSVLDYERNVLCLPKDISAMKLPFHKPVPPGREKYLTEEARDTLTDMYSVVYGVENVVRVPLQYQEFHEVKVFQTTYISARSRSTRSAAIAAVWPSPAGILSCRNPTKDDVQIGIIQYFLLHTPSVTVPLEAKAPAQRPHILACIDWYQDHPCKFSIGNGIILAATVCQPSYAASFMPISRIISQCAVVNRKMHMNYGEDLVCVALPLRHHHFL